MFMSGVVAVGIAALLIRKLFDETGEVLQQLWDRQLVLVPSQARSTAPRSNSAPDPSQPLAWRGIWPRIQRLPVIADRYSAFVDEFHATLNSRLSWVAGLVLATLMAMTFSYR